MRRWWGLRLGRSSRSMSSWVSGRMSMRRMSPRRRIMGGWPTFRCRSDASWRMAMRKSLLTSGSRGDFGSLGTPSGSVDIRTPVKIGEAGFSERPLEADGDAAVREVTFGDGNRIVLVVKDAGRQGRIGLAFGQHLKQMLGAAGPAAGHD